MKALFYIIATFFTCLSTADKTSFGTYSYETEHYLEKIELKDNNTFIYTLNSEFIKYNIFGNFNLRKDSLILDSYPQKDKMIVRESKQGNKNIITIKVTDKMGENIHYNLFITDFNDTKDSIIGQWNSSLIKHKKIKSFYIRDSKGLQSPEYKIKGKFSNSFAVQFETRRIFENEAWLIKDDKIYPKGSNGKEQNYYLLKK